MGPRKSRGQRHVRSDRLRALTILLLVTTAAACGGATRAAGDGNAAGAPTPAASDHALEALFWARADSARMRHTEADVHFVTGMIAHHAQAVLMARLVTDRAANPSIGVLAARIINAQEDEIALMQQWLRERRRPVPEIHISGTTLVVHGAGDHAMHAAGMVSDADLGELGAARGATFERRFLELMIDHHRGAVSMVAELFASDGAAQDPAVFRLASDIQVDQITEIARMEQMLARYSTGRGPR